MTSQKDRIKHQENNFTHEGKEGRTNNKESLKMKKVDLKDVEAEPNKLGEIQESVQNAVNKLSAQEDIKNHQHADRQTRADEEANVPKESLSADQTEPSTEGNSASSDEAQEATQEEAAPSGFSRMWGGLKKFFTRSRPERTPEAVDNTSNDEQRPQGMTTAGKLALGLAGATAAVTLGTYHLGKKLVGTVGKMATGMVNGARTGFEYGADEVVGYPEYKAVRGWRAPFRALYNVKEWLLQNGGTRTLVGGTLAVPGAVLGALTGLGQPDEEQPRRHRRRPSLSLVEKNKPKEPENPAPKDEETQGETGKSETDEQLAA